MLQCQSESVFRDRCGHIVRLFPKKLRSVAHENAPSPPRAAWGRSFGPSPKAKESLGAKPRYCITVFMPPALDRPFKMTSRMECSRRMKSSRSENARSKRSGSAHRLRPADKLVKSKVRHSSVGKGGHSMLLSHANSRRAMADVHRSSIHTPCSDSNSISMPHAYPASRICAASVCGIVRYSRSFPSRRMCPPMEQMYPSKPRARICGSMCRNGRPVLIMRMCPALCAFSARHARFRERRGPMSRSSRPHQKRGSFYSYFYYHPPTVCHKAAEM